MFRSSFVEDTSNPWPPSSTYINVGSLQNILNFAEKSGHIDRVGEGRTCLLVYCITIPKELSKITEKRVI